MTHHVRAHGPLCFFGLPWQHTRGSALLGWVKDDAQYIADQIATLASTGTSPAAPAAAAVTGSPWLLVVGLAGHGLKDLWQHRSHFVANTRWWPPFCMIVDWVVTAIIVGEIAAGMHFG